MEREDVTQVLDRLERIDSHLAELHRAIVAQRPTGGWFSTAEVAEQLGKAEFTIREWCRLGRIRAEKRGSGRGKHCAWVVSHDELLRYRREGLLPCRR